MSQNYAVRFLGSWPPSELKELCFLTGDPLHVLHDKDPIAVGDSSISQRKGQKI